MDLNVFFFPFPCPGHMIPIVDLACLFVSRGAKTTIVTTKANVPLIKPTIDAANCTTTPNVIHPINLLSIRFPSLESGLSEGLENLVALPNPDITPEFATAIEKLEEPFSQIVEAQKPDCVVVDMFIPWTTNISMKFGLPCLIFYSSSVFANIMHLDVLQQVIQNAKNENDLVQVQGLPHCIELAPSQLPVFLRRPMKLVDKVIEGLGKSYGIITNSFFELERDHMNMLTKCNEKLWHVGPLFLHNRGMKNRGYESSSSTEECIKWLDSKDSRSVLYVCFGSLGRSSAVQITEIALGLEASEHHFIWVMKTSDDYISESLPTGFEERLKINRKGLIIRGWAPQLLILNHDSVGGFLTHCGWNSSIEGISAGIPFITWPLFAEQFLNEKLITDVLRIGLGVGAMICTSNIEERTLVKAKKIKEVVDGLMGSSDEAKKRRTRAEELSKMARKATEKGGSSYNDMDNIIEELKSIKALRLSG